MSKKSLLQRDRAALWHPFTQMQGASPTPIVEGKGLYLYGERGEIFIDAISSWWVNLHGHAHPYISAKISSQLGVLEHVIFADFTHEPAVQLAERLLKLLPKGMTKIFYSDNGSTAVEAALKIALQYWYNKGREKKKIVCMKNSYHGDTFGAMSAAGKNELNRPFWSHLFDVLVIDPPISGSEEYSLAQLRNILKEDDVAAFIFEPLILGVGGMIIYSSEALDSLLRCCREHGVITIADEVMTGFGRTGKLFACENVREQADMICLSKGLTGGFLPLGVTACREEIFEAFLSASWSQAFLHGHSYTGNPLSCTAALASLELLLQESCLLQRQMIEQHHIEFCKQWKLHPKLKRCESLGTILIIEYKAESYTYFNSMRDRLYYFFHSRGFLLRPLGTVIYVMPPYCIQSHELEIIYDQIILTLEGESW